MGIGDRIAAERKSAGLSQGELGKRVNTGQTTVSSWERGRTEPTREDVQRIAEALGIEVARLELGNGPGAQPGRMVPVVGYVGAGSEAHLFSEGQGPFGEVEAPEGSTDDTVAVEIRGESLGALFNEWLVFYDDVQSPVRPALHGKLCVVGLPDGRVLVKQIKPAGDGRFHLISNTEDPLLDQHVDWAAKVKTMTPK